MKLRTTTPVHSAYLVRFIVVFGTAFLICCNVPGRIGGLRAWAEAAGAVSDEAIVRVENWSGDPQAAARGIQKAIDGSAPVVIIPYIGKPWVVAPLNLRSGKTLRLEPGVILEAEPGAFKDKHDSLISLENVEDVRIIGYGAVLRMHKSAYQGRGYERSQWRHGIRIRGSRRIEVSGIRVEKTGGDGIYIGPTWDKRRIPCEEIRISDCTCSENLRQGISIVSGRDVLVQNCLLKGSSGAAPQAGLDVEPSNERDLAVDIRIADCQAIDNAGSGFMVNLSRLSDASASSSIRFERCLVQGSVQPGLRALLDEDHGARGTVEFIECVVSDNRLAGLGLRWDMATKTRLVFSDCRWSNVGTGGRAAQWDLALRRDNEQKGSGVHFERCRLFAPNGSAGELVRLKHPGPFKILGSLEVFGFRDPKGASDLPRLRITKGTQRDEP